MGTMASPALLSVNHGSNSKTVTISIAGSASYATGGDTLDLSAATVSSPHMNFAVVDNITGGSDGGQYDARYDRATAGAPATCKVVIYNAGAADGGDEVANATDLSAVTFLLTITGR